MCRTLANLPIKHRTTAVVVITGMIVLLSAFITFVIGGQLAGRQSLLESTDAMTRILTTHSTPAVLFHN